MGGAVVDDSVLPLTPVLGHVCVCVSVAALTAPAVRLSLAPVAPVTVLGMRGKIMAMPECRMPMRQRPARRANIPERRRRLDKTIAQVRGPVSPITEMPVIWDARQRASPEG